MEFIKLPVEQLKCPDRRCEKPHLDIDELALKPHIDHTCLICKKPFKSRIEVVSWPHFQYLEKPNNVFYEELETLQKIEPGIIPTRHPDRHIGFL